MPITPLSLEESKKKEKEEEVGFFESALAGVVTGLWNIPKGFVSLGAEIFDLVGDTNTAKGVEQWFDDVNPFDDEAEARTVGKITQALTQIGIPAVQGYKIGASLASRALQAKKASKYMSMSKIGSKIMTPTAGGVVGGGIGEALVADEDIGTFADMARGTSLEPFAVTMMDKSTDKEGREEAFRRLKNRIKFGTEGALFNLGIIGAGKGIKALRGSGDKVLDEYSSNSIKRNFETFGEFGFSPAGTGPRSTFETKEYFEGMKKAANRAAAEEVKNLDNSLKSLGDNFYEEYLNARKTSKETRTGKEIFMEDLQEIISPTSKNSQRLLDPKAKTRAINELNALKEFKPLEEELTADDEDKRQKYAKVGSMITDGKELPLFDTIEEAEAEAEKLGCKGYHEHTQDGNTYYMPCENHEDITNLQKCDCTKPSKECKKKCDSYEDELDKFIAEFGEDAPEGYELIDEERVEDEDEDFDFEKELNEIHRLDLAVSTGEPLPEEPDRQDGMNKKYDLFKVRYEYAEDTGLTRKSGKSRTFCKRMMSDRKIYRKKDILLMGAKTDINSDWAPKGKSNYSIWRHKGGGNCQHFWRRKIYKFTIGVSKSGNLEDGEVISTAKARKSGFYPEANDKQVAQAPKRRSNKGFLNPELIEKYS